MISLNLTDALSVFEQADLHFVRALYKILRKMEKLHRHYFVQADRPKSATSHFHVGHKTGATLYKLALP